VSEWPALGRASLSARLAVDGYAFLPGYRRSAGTAQIAADFGEPLALWDSAVVQHLVPRRTSTPNTYSGIFGFGRFPFHTDLAHWRWPPRYLLLRCVRGFADVPTLLIDGRTVAAAVSLDVMRRAVVRPRRPQKGEMHFLRLWQNGDAGEELLRWDDVFLKPASRVGELAFQKVREHLEAVQPNAIAMSEASDTLIVDNWRMLHARPAIGDGREHRCLDRVYLGDLS
jgi:L-asparagine oxygenase